MNIETYSYNRQRELFQKMIFSCYSVISQDCPAARLVPTTQEGVRPTIAIDSLFKGCFRPAIAIDSLFKRVRRGWPTIKPAYG